MLTYDSKPKDNKDLKVSFVVAALCCSESSCRGDRDRRVIVYDPKEERAFLAGCESWYSRNEMASLPTARRSIAQGFERCTSNRDMIRRRYIRKLSTLSAVSCGIRQEVRSARVTAMIKTVPRQVRVAREDASEFLIGGP